MQSEDIVSSLGWRFNIDLHFIIIQGGWIVKLDVDPVNGGIKLDPDFLVDFGKEPNGAVLPHEMR